MLHFMEYFDPIQIRYGGNEFKRLIHAIENAANQAELVCMKILNVAIRAMTNKWIDSLLLQYTLFNWPSRGSIHQAPALL